VPLKKGPVAEWLGKALQKLLQRFESARDLLYFTSLYLSLRQSVDFQSSITIL
jgi:hypothetical protein